MLLCGCISSQMLISDMHRFNIYEIKQTFLSHFKKHVSVTVNSPQSRSESALLKYLEVAFACTLWSFGFCFWFGWFWVFFPGQLKVKFEEKLCQQLEIELSTPVFRSD